MSTTVLTAVVAKLAGLNAAAQAGVGLAVAAGAIGFAAGVPAVADASDASDRAVVVPSESPSDDPTADATADPTADLTQASADEPAADPTAGPADDPTADPTELPGWAEAEDFGAWVSERAREGGVDGQEIAAAAHERNAARRAEAPEPGAGSDDADEAGEDAADDPADAADVAPVAPAGGGCDRGRGRG